jgi:hypothetical protein
VAVRFLKDDGDSILPQYFAFLEPLADMDERHATTKRLAGYVQREALRRAFVSVAREYGPTHLRRAHPCLGRGAPAHTARLA